MADAATDSGIWIRLVSVALGNRSTSSFDSLDASVSAPHIARTRALRSSVTRSEEHTSELQSRPHLVCRLLLEKKKKHIDEGAVVAREGKRNVGTGQREHG